VVKLWEVDTGSSTTLVDLTSTERPVFSRQDDLKPSHSAELLSPDGRYLLLYTIGPSMLESVQIYDLHAGKILEQPSQRDLGSATGCSRARWHPSGRFVVTGATDGSLRVVPMDGGEPHLLYGHTSRISGLAVSPDGQWIASTGDATIRLWPMPEEGPPFHTLPYDELLARLRALTNYRAVPDESSPTGYRVEYDRLPSWETVPTW
jgi:WD40 repeat protein